MLTPFRLSAYKETVTSIILENFQGGQDMKWVEPTYCDLRLGFEVTAYVYVR